MRGRLPVVKRGDWVAKGVEEKSKEDILMCFKKSL